MINIKFFKYLGEPNVINKNLTESKNLIGDFYSEVQLLNPTLIIRGENINNYNYCYVEELNRYYFINNISYINDVDIKINLSLDVLKTYENIVLNATATITESSTADKYLSTRSDVFDVRPKFEVLDYPNDLFSEDGDIVMITIKGKET